MVLTITIISVSRRPMFLLVLLQVLGFLPPAYPNEPLLPPSPSVPGARRVRSLGPPQPGLAMQPLPESQYAPPAQRLSSRKRKVGLDEFKIMVVLIKSCMASRRSIRLSSMTT
ncbi:hypothetical protein DFJ58DRAFT_802201, partial [Suillus subalutaceus]|uniref:uncharacterized protein n=1 Tax=Suillus subalutaceus TaxID=48586 RepID=UPI001B886F26